ncbi:Uncharacterised protein [Klebsiella pneumoniae]|nr:Uncharacterised protein [Klebsiella pneumoniae]
MLMLDQVRIDIGLQTYREMMNITGGATNKGKNGGARIIQDACNFAQRCRPFLERTFFLLDDIFGPAVN